MSDPDFSGEFDVVPHYSQRERDLIAGYEQLEFTTRSAIEDFFVGDSGIRHLPCNSYFALEGSGDPFVTRLRGKMFRNLLIPDDGVALPDFDLAWKHFSDGNQRIIQVTRPELAPAIIKIYYTPDNSSVRAAYLLGEDCVHREIRRLNRTVVEENIDKRLRESLGFTDEEIENLSIGLTVEDKIEMMKQFDEIHGKKTVEVLDKPGKKELALLRRKYLRKTLPISRSIDLIDSQHAADAYSYELALNLGSDRVDRFTKSDIESAERKDRLGRLEARLLHMRRRKDIGAAVGAAAALSAGALTGQLAAQLIEITGQSDLNMSLPRIAGGVVGLVGFIRANKGYREERRKLPSFKKLQDVPGVQDQLNQEQKAARQYASFVKSLQLIPLQRQFPS